MRSEVEGLLLVDKPEGPTSHDVVARVRRLTGQRRVGHTGTLDPMASGLLPLVLGRATRLARFLPSQPKRYQGSLRLGLRTSSDDITGEVVARHEGPLPSADAVLSAANELRGTISQIPPAVSAKKIGGRRSYALAREGRTPEVRPVLVEVVTWELEQTTESDLWEFHAAVSTGTYVRALARDLGELLGCGGTLQSLRRTAIGGLEVAAAVPLPELGDDDAGPLLRRMIALDGMKLELPELRLRDEPETRRFRTGATIELPRTVSPEGMVEIRDPAGALLGVGDASEGCLRPRVVLAPAG